MLLRMIRNYSVLNFNHVPHMYRSDHSCKMRNMMNSTLPWKVIQESIEQTNEPFFEYQNFASTVFSYAIKLYILSQNESIEIDPDTWSLLLLTLLIMDYNLNSIKVNPGRTSNHLNDLNPASIVRSTLSPIWFFISKWIWRANITSVITPQSEG